MKKMMTKKMALALDELEKVSGGEEYDGFTVIEVDRDENGNPVCKNCHQIIYYWGYGYGYPHYKCDGCGPFGYYLKDPYGRFLIP